MAALFQWQQMFCMIIHFLIAFICWTIHGFRFWSMARCRFLWEQSAAQQERSLAIFVNTQEYPGSNSTSWHLTQSLTFCSDIKKFITKRCVSLSTLNFLNLSSLATLCASAPWPFGCHAVKTTIWWLCFTGAIMELTVGMSTLLSARTGLWVFAVGRRGYVCH